MDVDYESAICLGATTHVARKPHRCWTCGGPITPGQPYNRNVWKVLGEAGVDVERRHVNWIECPVMGEED